MRRAGVAVFGYGSLVSRASIAETLGRDAPPPLPATLPGWRRRWSLVRDNRTAEKGFEALTGDPFDHCLGLNVEPAEGDASSEPPNGALIALTAAELERLDLREMRYRRTDVTHAFPASGFEQVVVYTARPEHFAPAPPERAVVIASYLEAVETAFAELGERELERFRLSTGEPPVPVVAARLVRDEIPPGNPRAW
jgi:hypothetical protein